MINKCLLLVSKVTSSEHARRNAYFWVRKIEKFSKTKVKVKGTNKIINTRARIGFTPLRHCNLKL